MKKLLLVIALLVLAVPAYAWRTGIGGAVGWIEGGPATSAFLDLNPGPLSHMHVRPRAQVWLPDGREGVTEIGVDALYHLRPCAYTSLYAGVGVGAEWIGREKFERCACPNPPPPTSSQAKDPPIGVGIVGVRFLPGNSVDLGLEARGTVTTDRPRGGFFLVAVLHEARSAERHSPRHSRERHHR